MVVEFNRKLNVLSWFSLFLALILVLLVFNVQIVSAAEGDCYDITGSSSPISPNTEATPMNEGQLVFNTYTGTGGTRGCAHEQAGLGQSEHILKGWVWNTNLGWISLGSFGGPSGENVRSQADLIEFPDGTLDLSPKFNRGINTGNIAYSSMAVITNSSTGAGELRGYWWGDNAGWIRLNCSAYYTSDTTYCPSSNHSVSFAYNSVNEKYNLSGYAWSDSVGWINMTGVSLDLKPKTIANIIVQVGIVKDAQGVTPTVVANGEDKVHLGVRFLDGNTNVTQEILDYLDTNSNLTLCLLFKDDRLADNTVTPSLSGINQQLGVMSSCTNQTITRFSRFGTSLNSLKINSENYNDIGNDDSKYLSSKVPITSVVPSEGGEFQIIGAQFVNGAQTTDLELKDGVLDLQFINPFEVNLRVSNTNLSQQQCLSAIDNFKLSLGIPANLTLCGRFNGSSSVASPKVDVSFSGIDQLNSDDLDVDFCEDCTDEELEGETISLSGLTDTYGNNRFKARAIKNENSDASISEISQQLSGLGVKSVLEYRVSGSIGNFTVKRNGPALQGEFFRTDTIGGAGAIDSRAFVQLGGSGSSSGTASRAVIRDNVVKRVFDIVTAGRVNPSCVSKDQKVRYFSGDASTGAPGGRGGTRGGSSGGGDENPPISGGGDPVQGGGGGGISAANSLALTFFNTCKPNPSSSLYYVNNAASSRILIDYETIKSFFEDNDENLKTLVLVGYDIYFGNNVVNTSDDFPSLVLFRNKSGYGGNVYIGPDVTELKGYVYADRSFFSVDNYNSANNANPLGVPDSSRMNANLMFNELALIGRFFGENCVGCALENPPKKGDGSIADNFNEARAYDLTYFRFSSLTYRTGVEEVVPGIFIEVYLTCDDNSNGDQVDPDGTPPEYSLCWVRNPSTGFEKDSPFLKAQRDEAIESGSYSDSDRKAVNFIHGSQPGLPVFF